MRFQGVRMTDLIVVAVNKIPLIKDVLLGMVGGATSYLVDWSNAKRTKDSDFIFRLGSLVVNTLMGATVGYAVGSILPEDTAGRNAIVLVSGVCSFTLLVLAQSQAAEVILDYVSKIGIRKKDNKKE